MPVRSRDAATRDRNGFVSVSMAPAGRDAACEDPHPDGGQRDRQPEREVAPEVPGRSPVDPLGQERALDAERLEGRPAIPQFPGAWRARGSFDWL